MIGAANPGLDMNYNPDDANLKHKHLMVLWNIHKFLIDLSKQLNKSPEKLDIGEDKLDLEERFILSKLHTTIMDVTKLFDEYRLNEVPPRVEELFLEISRTYIQLIRDKAAIGTQEDREVVLSTIYKVLIECLKIFAPVAPFITEQIYLNLQEEFNLEEESIHLCDWPKHDVNKIHSKVESQMDIASAIIQSILYAREKAQISLRWPLSEAIIVAKDEGVRDAINELQDLIKNQTNIKDLKLAEQMEGVKESVKPDFAKLGPVCGQDVPKVVAKLSTESAETILSHIEKDGSYKVEVDGNSYDINKTHLVVERTAPDGYNAADSRYGIVYLNDEMTPKLEAEGFARELMRKVQALRKNEGLEKTDGIELYIKSETDLVNSLHAHRETIANKCGASEVILADEDAAKKYDIGSQEKIKGKIFDIFFTKR